VTLRAGVLLAVMAGIGLRAVSWLMLTQGLVIVEGNRPQSRELGQNTGLLPGDMAESPGVHYKG
jgi:hypothetical protein